MIAPTSHRRNSENKVSQLLVMNTQITFKKTPPSPPQIEGIILPGTKEIVKKGKNINLFEQSEEEVSLISEEDLNKKNINRSSEDSSPDLLSLSD